MKQSKRQYIRPTRLFVLTAGAIFLGEVIVMFVLAVLAPIPVVAEAFVDGAMITTLMIPFLYFLVYVPMADEIDRRREAQEELETVNRELDQRIEERTVELSRTNERLKRQIAETDQAREEIWKDREFIRSVVEVAPCLLVIYEVGSRRCIYANGRVEEFLGYEVEDVLGGDRDFLKDVLSPDDYSRFAQVLLEPAASESSTVDLGEIRMRRRSGKWSQMRAGYTVLRRDPQDLAVEVLLTAIATP